MIIIYEELTLSLSNSLGESGSLCENVADKLLRLFTKIVPLEKKINLFQLVVVTN